MSLSASYLPCSWQGSPPSLWGLGPILPWPQAVGHLTLRGDPGALPAASTLLTLEASKLTSTHENKGRGPVQMCGENTALLCSTVSLGDPGC